MSSCGIHVVSRASTHVNMKIALISDVHGNYLAFQTVMDQIDAEGVDQILCLGDVIATGPQPAECVELLQTLNIPTVMGNADAWLLAPRRDPEAREFIRFIEEVDLWCREQLSAAARDFIAAFQPTLEIPLSAHKRLLAFHGSPRSFTEQLTATTPDATLAELLPDPSVIIMAGGHTHQQLLRRYRDIVLLNPGSVGLGYERDRSSGEPHNVGWAEYAIIENKNGALRIDLRRLPYNVDKLKAIALASGMPQAKRWSDGWS